jgi:hypothetical protein
VEYQDLKTLSKMTSISVFTLRKFVKMGMPHFRLGRKILIKPDDFREWFEGHCRASSVEPTSEIDRIVSEALKEVGMKST